MKKFFKKYLFLHLFISFIFLGVSNSSFRSDASALGGYYFTSKVTQLLYLESKFENIYTSEKYIIVESSLLKAESKKSIGKRYLFTTKEHLYKQIEEYEKQRLGKVIKNYVIRVDPVKYSDNSIDQDNVNRWIIWPGELRKIAYDSDISYLLKIIKVSKSDLELHGSNQLHITFNDRDIDVYLSPVTNWVGAGSFWQSRSYFNNDSIFIAISKPILIVIALVLDCLYMPFIVLIFFIGLLSMCGQVGP